MLYVCIYYKTSNGIESRFVTDVQTWTWTEFNFFGEKKKIGNANEAVVVAEFVGFADLFVAGVWWFNLF